MKDNKQKETTPKAAGGRGKQRERLDSKPGKQSGRTS